MSDGWTAAKISELARVRSGFAFKSSQWTDDGVPVVKIGNVKRGRLDMAGCSYVTKADAAQSGFLLSDGDILIGLTGYVGEVAKVREFGPLVLNQRVGKFFPTPNCDPNFLFFLVSNEDFRRRVEAASHGSAQANVSPSAIESFEVLIPPLPEQRAIAATLGALDDKIELNRKMNATLEAMARALFRDWFVDFGPTRAKMEGRAPYLSPDLWSPFPEGLDAEGKPEGWEVSSIGEEVRVVGGSTPSTKEPDLWDGGINWATPKDLSTLAAPVLLETSRTISAAGLTKISSGQLPVGSLLLSSRAPIGYLAIAEVPVAINQGFIGMICDKRVSNVFAWLWTLENMEAILAKANGSTFQEISKGNFRPLPVVVPPEPVLRAFDAVAQPLYDRIAKNERESRTLAQTRDLLLPRLMSGQILVQPDAMAG